MSHHIQTYTVRNIENIIILSTRTDVGQIIDSIYSDDKAHMSLRI